MSGEEYDATGAPIRTVKVQVGSTPPQLDDTNKVAVSLYGKNVAAGDTPLKVDAGQNLRVSLMRPASLTQEVTDMTMDDNVANPVSSLAIGAPQRLFNGTTWDRGRNNAQATILAGQADTLATRTSVDQTNYNARGLLLHVKIGALAGAPTFTPSIQMKAPDGSYVTIWTAAAALAANGDAVYILYPGATGGAATEIVGIPLPRVWRGVLTYAGNGATDAATTLVDLSYVM